MFLDSDIHDVKCEPATPSTALFSPSPVLITLALWVLHMRLVPFPHSTCCSAVPRVSSLSPSSGRLCLTILLLEVTVLYPHGYETDIYL